MIAFLSTLFSTEGFMPHGHCYLWQPGILWLHIISDSLIVLAYYSIPVTLIYFVRKRRDLAFDWMFVCFAVFILACGTTHLMEIWNVWHPSYWLSGAIKALTALASIPTAILLVKLVPLALALPSPAALKIINQQLESEIVERERVEQALQDKNAELKNINLTKDHFLAGMSHELRTPLNAIIGFTGTLLMKLPGPLTFDQDKQLKTVQTSARHLLSLINDLLDVARIESGKLEMEMAPVVCQEVVKEVIDSLRPLAEQKGLALKTEMPSDPITLDTDRRALSQILLNFVNNAIKFTETGGITLSLTQRAENAHLITEFKVDDSGVGIRALDQAGLFQAFGQLDFASTRRYDGTGLGLYLSQRLARMINGHLSVASEYGKGSSFILELKSDRP